MRLSPVTLTLAGLLMAPPAFAHERPWRAPGSRVGVSIEVEGHEAPLYAAVDGSGRFYVEAHPGGRYSVRLDNRTSERLGVLLTVDGLNAISGEREPEAGRRRPGRMYVLDPLDTAVVQGWRTSLEDVRRFTFVDERSSYAARSGKANAKMGWIELAVYRESPPWRGRGPWDRVSEGPSPRAEAERDAGKSREVPEAAAPPADVARPAPDDLKSGAAGGAGSYPGTGWGSRAHDPAMVVEFHPEAHPAERITIRYEYARALQALGIFPRPWNRDRLGERERGDGFAKPPRW